MKYAMVYDGRVLMVKESADGSAPEMEHIEEGHPVTAIPCDENVRRGWSYDEATGAFKKMEIIREPSQLDRIEMKIQINTDLQSFYEDIMKEVGL